MRLAMFVEGLLLPSAEGATWRFLQILRGLAAAGIDVLVVHSYRGWSDIRLMAAEPYRVLLVKPEDYYGNSGFLRAILAQYGVDQVLCKDPAYLRFLIQSGALPPQTKTIFDCHDLLPCDSAGYGDQVWALHNANAIVAISRNEADTLTATGFGAKTAYIPSTVSRDTLCEAPLPEREDGKIAFLGHFYYEPNMDAARWLARDILPRVRQLKPDAELHLIGTHPASAPTEISGPGIHWVGYASDVNAALRSCDVAFSGVRMGTGFRVKTLHYMKAGIPVVSNALGVEGVGVRDCFRIAETSSDLAVRIADLLAAPVARRGIAREALSVLKHEFLTEDLNSKLIALTNLVATSPPRQSVLLTKSIGGAHSLGWWNEIVRKGRFSSSHSDLFPPGLVFDLKNPLQLRSILTRLEKHEVAI